MRDIDKMDVLDALHHIKKVDAPEFLFTRIEQKLKNEKSAKIPAWAVYALSTSLAIVLFVNVFAIVSYSKSSRQEANLAKAMNLLPSNNIYSYE